MADSYKDIIITPNRSNTADPKIDLRGGNSSVNTAITVTVYPDSNGTISFDGSAGQLFSITNDLSGLLWSVNDVSGIPSAEVYANGSVRFAEFGGNVSIGTATNSSKLFVNGNTTVNGSINVTSTAALGNTTITGFANVSSTVAAGNTTITGFANVSGIVSADYFTAANNGNGTNYKVGDDAWIGDVNSADTVGIKGQQNTSLGFIKFGTAPTTLGYNGSSLVYSSNVSFGNISITGFINVSSTAQFADTVRIANDKRIIFNNPTAGNGARLVHQSDDNFVFYVASTTGAERAIWSTMSNSNTSAFTVATAITATGDITAFFSDDRLKDRYSNIPHAIEKVKSLNGFYYEPNITAQDLGYQKEMHVGVSAQEVNAIMPEVVAPAPIDNKYLTVKYERLIPLLIEAIKEQQIQIDELKAQLSKD